MKRSRRSEVKPAIDRIQLSPLVARPKDPLSDGVSNAAKRFVPTTANEEITAIRRQAVADPVQLLSLVARAETRRCQMDVILRNRRKEIQPNDGERRNGRDLGQAVTDCCPAHLPGWSNERRRCNAD